MDTKAKYERRLRNERLTNKELGRRISQLRRECQHWKEQYEAERIQRVLDQSEIERLKAKLLLSDQHGKWRAGQTRSVKRGAAERRGEGTQSAEYKSGDENQSCNFSPKRDTHPKLNRCSSPTPLLQISDTDDMPYPLPVRSSFEALLRSSANIFRTGEPRTPQKHQREAHLIQDNLACAFFVAGATYDSAANVMLRTRRKDGLQYGYANPVVLCACGSVDMDATGSPSQISSSCHIEILLPELVSNMCFPDGVRLEEKQMHIGTPLGSMGASVSVFSMSVPRSSSGDHSSCKMAAPPLYGIFASIEHTSHMSTVEHADSGVMLSLPFTVCFLTREPHFAALSKIVRKIVHIERHRLACRMDLLRHGDISSHAIHTNGQAFGKLSGEAVQIVGHTLGIDVSCVQHMSCQLQGENHMEYELPKTCKLSPKSMFAWCAPDLVRSISIERLLVVLGCALAEVKIVFVSKQTSILGSSVLALSCLLMPLIWSGPLVPVLPTHLLHMLEAPFPLLAGVTQMRKSTFQVREHDTVIVDLDRGRIFLPTTVTSAFHKYKLQALEKLCTELHHVERRIVQNGDPDLATDMMIELYETINERICQILKESQATITPETDPFIAKVQETQMYSYYMDNLC